MKKERSCTSRRQFIKTGITGISGLLLLGGCGITSSGREPSSLTLVCMADLHSATDKMARILPLVKSLASQEEAVIVLINGDVFERHPVSLSSGVAAERDFLRQLSALAPVFLNAGNHEGAVSDDMREVAQQMETDGVQFISNMREISGGEPLAPPVVHREVNGVRFSVVGIATDDLSTYRAIHNERWAVPEAFAYAAEELPGLWRNGRLNILMDHDGVLSDRAVFPTLPKPALLLGGHDHLRFITEQDQRLALHTGSYGETVDIVRFQIDGNSAAYEIESITINDNLPADAAFLAMAKALEETHLPENLKEIVAANSAIATQTALMKRMAAWLRESCGTDAAALNNTTFGAAMPLGEVRLFDVQRSIRFDGNMWIATLSGSDLITLRNKANQFELDSWEGSTGEYVAGSFPETINPGQTYTLAVNGWVAVGTPFNQMRFLGSEGHAFTQADPPVMIRQTLITNLNQP
ncbi:MAG: metallophosphoesterase [Candidatus Cyclonatronum sp.]|uniref:metallophosphoesterase n=1 Tax=Cyclonatronum sp. TaxID=3024185 RepID=UPI0025C66E23|nr:metallophosphoesterase [Cyclonatronum sp.]MCH8487868.1 metallophosphoesterase [Cyclonatronum sp.]